MTNKLQKVLKTAGNMAMKLLTSLCAFDKCIMTLQGLSQHFPMNVILFL